MKVLIEWTPDLTVGIQEIDEQHKILIKLLNDLYHSIIKRTENEVIYDILNELVQYTVVHFAVEESLMRIFNYPNYDEHKKHHEELKKQVIELQTKVWDNEALVSMELLKFLKDWLTKHILMEDKKYSPFFLKRGLEQNWAKKSWVGKIWDYVQT